MRTPHDYWHREVLDESIISRLDTAVQDSDSAQLICTAKRLTVSRQDGETPEYLAKTIGYMIADALGNDFTTPAQNDTDGREGESLAYGYIGIKAIELASEPDK